MRVFAAIEIPDGIKEGILEASRYFALRDVTLVRKEALHITLQFFGEIEDKDVAVIKSAMDSIKTGGFEVTVQGISYFKPERIRVVYAGITQGADKITGIHNRLAESMKIHDEERFLPHVTIARVRGMKDRRAFVELATEYEEHNFGTFAVDSLVLKKSTLTSGGPVYELLHESKL